LRALAARGLVMSKAIDSRRQTLTDWHGERCALKAPAGHAGVKAGYWGVYRMSRMAAVLATLMTVGASSVALAEQAYLGDWARADGKTKIHVAGCGASVCARNTWVKHGSGEKVGDRLILKVKPAGAGHWSGSAFDPQRKQNYAINVRVTDRHMTTRGCVMDGFVCQSMGWNRMH
jgi:uncharacterized protein (DUF2147 family)